MPAFSPSEIKTKIAFHPAFELDLDEAALGQLSTKLQEVGCDNLDYLDWVLDRMAARKAEQAIGNPAGYLLTVAGLREWIDDWRKGQPVREALRERRAPPGPPAFLEPDDPKAVQEMLDGLPWKPGGVERGGDDGGAESTNEAAE